MSGRTAIEELLDEWEDRIAADPSLTIDRFINEHCGGLPAPVIAEIRQQIEELAAIDAHLASLDARSSVDPSNTAGRLALKDLQIGVEPIPGYTLAARLGGGGFGEVWKASAPGGFDVALKFVRIESRAGRMEERSLAVIQGVRHPHLLSIFGDWRIGGLLIITSELAERTLLDRFDEARAAGDIGIPRDELLRYMDEAAKGLDFLNDPPASSRPRIQHRDVKPQNLLLSGGSIKVGDFGLARVLQHETAKHTASLTFAYAAPESFDGMTTTRSDQYSLAVTYCQLRCGRLPFQGTPVELMEGHRHGAPDLSMLSPEERPIVAKAMAKNPADRWKSCSEFVRQLSSATQGVSPPIRSSRSKRQGIAILSLLALVAAIGAGVVMKSDSVGHRQEETATSNIAVPIVTRPDETSAGSPAMLKAPFSKADAERAQQAWAMSLGREVRVTNSVGMMQVLIPPGGFMMGSQESISSLAAAFPGAGESRFLNEYPAHRVRITKPLYVGFHEVTKAQFARFVEATEYRTEAEVDGKGGFAWNDKGRRFEQKPEYTWRNAEFPQEDDHPVVNVSWNDAITFCSWLSKSEGNENRLPTEAEWEYACRAGTATRYQHGDAPDGLADVGNVADATAKRQHPRWNTHLGDDGFVNTAPVGRFRPNQFGVFDMHGNVWEWCSDWFDITYYQSSAVDDPTGPPTATSRVSRGGGWGGGVGIGGTGWGGVPRGARCSGRGGFPPQERYSLLGFRVVRTIAPSKLNQ